MNYETAIFIIKIRIYVFFLRGSVALQNMFDFLFFFRVSVFHLENAFVKFEAGEMKNILSVEVSYHLLWSITIIA